MLIIWCMFMRKSICITEEQDEFVRKRHVNLSSMIRTWLDSWIKDEKFKDKKFDEAAKRFEEEKKR